MKGQAAPKKKTLSRRAPLSRLIPPLDAPRRFRRTTLDFRTLHLPRDVAVVLSDAFWHRAGAAGLQTMFDHWSRLRFFGRFNKETRAVRALSDLKGDILVRYVGWLNAQSTAEGTSLSKATRASTYTSLLKLLQWIARCRPGLLGSVDWSVRPFPWRNRDTKNRRGIPAARVRELLKACERDIAATRLMRREGEQLRELSRAAGATYRNARGAILDFIDSEFGGVLPPTPIF